MRSRVLESSGQGMEIEAVVNPKDAAEESLGTDKLK